MDRRSFIAGASVLAGTQFLPHSTISVRAQQAEKFVLADLGGIFDAAYKSMTPLIREKIGFDLVTDPGTSEPMLAKLQAANFNSPYDAIYFGYDAVVTAADRGLLRPVTLDEVPSLARVDKRILEPLRLKDGSYAGIPTDWKALGIIWRKDKVPFEITSWSDLWRPELRNRISVQNMPTLGGALLLLAAARINGGGLDNMEPGWKAMRELKPNIREFYAITSAALNSLTAGDTWVSVNTLDLGLPLASKNVVPTVPKEGVNWAAFAICIPKGSRSAAKALKFANFMLEDAQQATWASLAKVAPSISVPLSPEAQQNIIESEALVPKLFDIDFLSIGRAIPQWTARWRKEVAE